MKNPLRYLVIAVVLVLPSVISAQTYVYFPVVDSLDINNIKVAHRVHGDMWHRNDLSSLCEYPKGSGLNAGFSASIWMAGYDAQSQLHLSGQLNGPSAISNKTDFWPGPLLGLNGNPITYSQSQDWARVWKLTRTELNTFLTTPVHTMANTPKAILEWPARGNPYVKGYNNANLSLAPVDYAPFVDVNNDFQYNALQGDYPKMKGDMMLWNVFNDYGPSHNQSNGLPLGMQVNCMAYAFDRNTVLGDIVFYEYQYLYMGTQALDSFVIGVFADMDLGSGFDDYIGYDSSRNMGIVYNGDLNDQGAYQDSIPMSGICILRWIHESYPCDSAIPAGSFTYFLQGSDLVRGEPTNAIQMNNYLRHRWRNGTPLTDSIPNYGNLVKYAFPGDPNIGGWSECSNLTLPYDKKFVIASPPITLNPGQINDFAFALVASPKKYQNGCPNATYTDIRLVSDTAKAVYCKGLLAMGVNDLQQAQSALPIYPNPASLTVNIKTSSSHEEHIDLYDGTGRTIKLPILRKGDVLTIDVSSLAKGVYLIRYSSAGQTSSASFIKD